VDALLTDMIKAKRRSQVDETESLITANNNRVIQQSANERYNMMVNLSRGRVQKSLNLD